MRWKHRTNFIRSGSNGYILSVDSDCKFTLKINSVNQSHEGDYRCELDGESNEDPPISAERTLSIARESGCLSVSLSISLSDKSTCRVSLNLLQRTCVHKYILTHLL